MKKQNKKGFTLVELLVVIAILAILATVSVVGYSQFTEKAKKSNDETELHQIALIVEAQLIDGEEIVKLDDSNTITFKYDSTGVTATCSNTEHSSSLGENELKNAVVAIIGTENVAFAQYLNVSIDDNKKLTLTYQHNAKTPSTWTLGKQLATVSVVGYSQFTTKAKESNDMVELHQYTTLIEAQLMDGEEKVTISGKTYVIKYSSTGGITIERPTSDSSETTPTDKDILTDAIKAMINETNLTELSTGGTMTVEYTANKLTIKYNHNLDTATANTTWTLGKQLETVSVVGYSQFTKKAKESNDNTELHQYATLLQAALVDGEEVVDVTTSTDGTTTTTYKLMYSTSTKNVTCASKTSTATEYSTAVETLTDNELTSTIIKNMLISTNEAIEGANLYATLTNGTLKLYYQHHVAANATATDMTGYVSWTFGYQQ